MQENLKLKEKVDNEKELWMNKANNLKRNTATKKPDYKISSNKNLLSADKEEDKQEIKNQYLQVEKSKNIIAQRQEGASNINNMDYHNKNTFKDSKAKIIQLEQYTIDKSHISDFDYSEDERFSVYDGKINKKLIVSDVNSDIDDFTQK